MIELRVSGTKKLLSRLRRLQSSVDEKTKEFLTRLAEIGITEADVHFRNAVYDGDNDAKAIPTPEWVNENTIAVVAEGKKLLFVEFGSGLIGYGDDPSYAQKFGYGPGTWSDDLSKGGKGHWSDPNGWYYKHGEKSYGNPPARAMYEAAKVMRQEILNVAREVFNGD